MEMLAEVTELLGTEVYSDKGILVGTITDIILDMETQFIHGLFIERSNPSLVEGGASISVPYRWIKAIGEIILLKKFPEFVKIGTE
ncbi:photosystem reaction center subunit H [uncultured archaeon]|nr:photosystem reaction center subunit H [uncultured archaeon]HKJ97012.1 PRC-barrel domain-containing protein [Thermoplasmataceae archaeon]